MHGEGQCAVLSLYLLKLILSSVVTVFLYSTSIKQYFLISMSTFYLVEKKRLDPIIGLWNNLWKTKSQLQTIIIIFVLASNRIFVKQTMKDMNLSRTQKCLLKAYSLCAILTVSHDKTSDKSNNLDYGYGYTIFYAKFPVTHHLVFGWDNRNGMKWHLKWLNIQKFHFWANSIN